MKLGVKVRIKHTGEEGWVIARSDYLAGYTTYLVQPAERGLLAKNLVVHEPEVEIINRNDVVSAPKPNPDYKLGSFVSLAFEPEIQGIITAHCRSISGCAQYEVTYHDPASGVNRQIFEEQVLELLDEEPIEEGNEGGSVFERHVITR